MRGGDDCYQGERIKKTWALCVGCVGMLICVCARVVFLLPSCARIGQNKSSTSKLCKIFVCQPGTNPQMRKRHATAGVQEQQVRKDSSTHGRRMRRATQSSGPNVQKNAHHLILLVLHAQVSLKIAVASLSMNNWTTC